MFYSAMRAKKSMNTIKSMPLIPMELYPLGSRGQLLDICGNNKRAYRYHVIPRLAEA